MNAKRRRAAKAAAVDSIADATTTPGSALAVVSLSGVLVDPTEAEPYREPVAGEYWRVRKGWLRKRNLSFVKGTVLLIKDARRIDGVLHSVEVAAHPFDADRDELDEARGSYVLMLDEFREHFVFEPDGERVRRAEMAAVQRDAEEAQQQLLAGPAPGEIPEPPQTLLALPARPSLRSAATELASAEMRANLDRAVHAQLAFAEKSAAWLTERHAEITLHGARLLSFYREQSLAASVRVAEVQRFAASLNSNLKTMGLYLGEGVAVEQLVEGEPAPPSEPLTLFQRRLNMDEEYAVHMALGGAHWSDFPEFAAELKANHALLERVLPTPRCVVAMRARNRETSFEWPTDVQSAIAKLMSHLEQDRLDKVTFLLVRNGDNVYRVDSELGTQFAERLFPTNNEKDEPFARSSSFFRGIDVEFITPENTRYFEARNKYDAIMLFYRRLMLLMAGLNDRSNLFGTFYNSGEYESFMSLKLQTERFRYVYDEDMMALGEGRPSFSDWWIARNADIRVGSRILINWHAAMSTKSAPGKHYFGERQSKADEYGNAVAIVEQRKGRLYVSVPWKYSSYSDRIVNLKVWLQDEDGAFFHPRAFLVLDTADVTDLDYYIESRAARPAYLAFLGLFLSARKVLLADREREAGPRAGVADALRTARPMLPAADIQAAVNAAVQAYRVRGRGAPLPIDKAAGSGTLVSSLFALADGYLRETHDVRSAAAVIAQKSGREPLRVERVAGKGLRLYATALADELPFGDAVPLQYVAEATLSQTGATISAGRFSVTTMPRVDARAPVVTAWPGHEAYAVSETFRVIPYDVAARVRALLSDVPQHLESVWGSGNAEAFAADDRFHVNRLGNNEYSVVVPIGIVLAPDRFEREMVYQVLFIEEFEASALYHMAPNGPQVLLELLRSKRVGMNKRDAMERLKSARTSVPNFEAKELRNIFVHEDRSAYANFGKLGYAMVYTHSVNDFETVGKRPKAATWGDDLANQLEEMLDRRPRPKKSAPQVVFLAEGVEQWLRGRTRSTKGNGDEE